jgi:tRNA(fMet)-specific endonuclease VapC
MGVIVDTSILIATERRRFAWSEFMTRHADESVAIAAITVSELLLGGHRTPDAFRRSRRLAAVETMLSKLFVFAFGPLEARLHAQVRASLLDAGGVIGAHDLLIAATALAQGCAIATLDSGHFSRVPGLQLVDTSAFVRG